MTTMTTRTEDRDDDHDHKDEDSAGGAAGPREPWAGVGGRPVRAAPRVAVPDRGRRVPAGVVRWAAEPERHGRRHQSHAGADAYRCRRVDHWAVHLAGPPLNAGPIALTGESRPDKECRCPARVRDV